MVLGAASPRDVKRSRAEGRGPHAEAGPTVSDRRPLMFHDSRYASLLDESVLPVAADLSGLLTATGADTWF